MKDFSALPPLPAVIEAHGLMARKSLGQHFLLNSAITDQVAHYAGELSGCNVIEIGPGPGGLTRSLLAAGAKQLYVVEKDDRCIAVMRQLQDVAEGRLHIIHGDALKVDLLAQVPAPRKIVANLPYNAGTAMLLQWLGQVYDGMMATPARESYQSMTLMFQKEVALRIVAEPGCKDFGRLSVISQWLCDCRYDFELPPEAFSPPPKVESAVVTLTPRDKPIVDVDKDALETVVAKAFGQRRKMLRQALKGLAVPADALLAQVQIEGTQRAEQLTVNALAALAQHYRRLLSQNPNKKPVDPDTAP